MDRDDDRQADALSGGNDASVVAQLLGREPAGAFAVVVRRPGGSPVVIENEPLLRDGRPMPTRFWLVDRRLRDEVSRLEAAGGVRRAETAVSSAAVAAAHARYARERERLVPPGHSGPTPSGGVGGTRLGVKCLHAHLAWFLAGGHDPVGTWTADVLGVRRDAFEVEDGVGLARHAPVAALDCGTNSTRLLIAGPDGTALERRMRITRLGEGVDASRRLSPVAIARTLDVLGEYRNLMDASGVVRARLAATSAVRDALNGKEFLEPAEAVTGVRPEVLPGDEEGRLSFAGATAHLPAGLGSTESVLVVDIGGGSTELSLGDTGRSVSPTRGAVATRSLDIGCVRLSERFLTHDPPRSDEIATARTAVQADVSAARRQLPQLDPTSLLVGLAGTVSTLAALEHGVRLYDRALIHHAVLERSAVDRWLETLSNEDAAARLARPGMAPGRQDVIVGGVLILAVVMEVFGRGRCLVSEDDILDGLVSSLITPR